MDYEGDLYGREMTLHFCAFLRPTRKMTSLTEVEAQVEKDMQSARSILEWPEEDRPPFPSP